MMGAADRSEVCVVACAEAFRGDGEILAAPIGVIPTIGVRLAGARGPPGTPVPPPTGCWGPRAATRVFPPRVDMVAGVGYDNAAKAGPAATRYQELRRVVSNLASFDWYPGSRRLRLLSVH